MEESLEFTGKYRKGKGWFSHYNVLPGRCPVTELIDGWPAIVYPGTMNVEIDLDGFPDAFVERFGAMSVEHLDFRQFRPITEIPFQAFPKNDLPPIPTRPDQGNGQVWRASITKIGSRNSKGCWLFRRIGSTYVDVLEFVAGESLSAALELSYEDPVRVVVYGTWVDP